MANHPNRAKPAQDRAFPWLSDALQEPAARAKALGLTLSHFNSGSRHNELNGTRIHEAADERGYADYFQTPFVAHVRSLRELNAWLDGRASSQPA